VVLLGALLLAGCGPAVVAQNKQPAAAVQASGALEVVVAGQPVRKTLTLVSNQPARIEPIAQAPLYSRLSGYVAEVLIDYGDKVEAGQPLVKLALPELEAELLQKQALIEQAQAEVQQAKSAVRGAAAAVETAEAGVVQAEAAVARTESDIRRWKSEFARYEQLLAQGAVNQQLVDETQQKLSAAQSARAEADAAIASAKAAVTQSQAEIDKAEADVVAAEARQRVAEANRKFSEAMLAYGEITAPFAGVVTRRGVDPGHFVQPPGGQSAPLLVLARTDVVRVFISVPEHEAAYVDIGDEVSLEVQSLRGAVFHGQVTRTSFAIEAANRSLETIVDLANDDGRLRTGMFATARLTLDVQEDALTLPAAAVVRKGNEAFCYRLAKGKAAKTLIQLGIRVGDDFQVTSGLTEDDTVILNKAGALQDGQQVETAP
jgi:RND family efflux transporter MFP subunit